MSTYGQAAEVFIDEIKQEGIDKYTQCARAIDSLKVIAKKFEGWKDVLYELRRLPHDDTIEEMIEGFQDFGSRLKRAEQWLEQKDEQFWLEFMEQIKKLRLQFRQSEIREIISNYYILKSESTTDFTQFLSYLQKTRMKLGDLIDDYLDIFNFIIETLEEMNDSI